MFHLINETSIYPHKTNYFRATLIFLAGMVLAVGVAYLVAAGQWPVALGLMMSVPAATILYRYPFFGLILWLFFTPFLVDTDGGSIRKVYWIIHRALPPALIGLIMLSAWLGPYRRKLPRLGWAEAGMAGYVVISILSILYLSHSVKPTLVHYYDRVIVPMMLYLLVRFLRPTDQDLRRLLPVLAFIVLSQSIIGILSWVAPGMLPSAWLGRAGIRTTGSLRAYSVFTSTVVFCGLVILHAGLSQRDKARRWWAASLFSLTIVMVFLSFSRGSWLAGILVMMGLVYLYPRFVMRYAVLAIPVVALVVSGGLMSNYMSWASHRLYSDQSQEEAMSRLPIYYASYQMFAAKPLLGWGFGNFDRYDRQFQERVASFNPEKDHASHNVYFTLIAEQGLVGFGLFMAPLAWWLLQTLKVWPGMPGQGLANKNLLFMLWLVILFHIVVNNFSNMRVVFGLGMWWVTLGLIAHVVESGQQYKDKTP